MIPVSPSREEVEAKKASLRHLGAHDLQRRVDSDEIGFGSWERRVAQSVLWDIAAEKRAIDPCIMYVLSLRQPEVHHAPQRKPRRVGTP